MTDAFLIVIQIASGLSISLGCVFVIGGALGLVRFPDFYTRIHAASVTDTGGIALIMFGLILQAVFVFDHPMAAIKLMLVLVFLFFTAPTASHALAKAALSARIVPKCRAGRSAVDESLQAYYGADHNKSNKTTETQPHSSKGSE